MNTYQQLLDLIHSGRNPYHEFPWQNWVRVSPDWGSSHEWLHETVQVFQPKLIIEVGSWLGASAIHMASFLPADGVVLCVDTWLGGVDHRLTENADGMLGWHYGRPTLFYSFLANVMRAGLERQIIPFPLDTLNAARFLKEKNITADMIYVDASHEGGDVRRDLDAYWPLLRSGGVMLVDDLTGYFPGLVKDVSDFVEHHQLAMEVRREKGRIVKS